MTVGETTVGKMTVGKTTVGEMMYSLKNYLEEIKL